MSKRKRKKKKSWADRYHREVWGNRVSPRIPPLTPEQEQEQQRKQAEIREHAARELARWERGDFQPKATRHPPVRTWYPESGATMGSPGLGKRA